MTRVITTAQMVINHTSCSAAWQAFSFLCCPRYWPATTAPPVPNAANTLMSSTMILSTRDTPDTAASPTLATMMLSAIPTRTASICSMISGMMRAISARLSNRYGFFSVCSVLIFKISPAF